MEIINSVEVREDFEDLDDLIGHLNSLLNNECDPDTGTYPVKDMIYFAREYKNCRNISTILIKTILSGIPFCIQRALDTILIKNTSLHYVLWDIQRTEKGCVIVLSCTDRN